MPWTKNEEWRFQELQKQVLDQVRQANRLRAALVLVAFFVGCLLARVWGS